MGLFSRLTSLFERESPNRAFYQAYLTLYLLSKKLLTHLSFLKTLQKQLIKQLQQREKSSAGRIALSKTLVIEEEFIPKLKKITKIAERRFRFAGQEMHAREPVSAEEELELRKINKLLERIEHFLVEEERLKKAGTTKEKLLLVEASLKETADLLRDFHRLEKYGLVKQVLRHRISPLLKKIFYYPHQREILNHQTGKKETIYEYAVTPQQLERLQDEAERINSYNDGRYRVIWRRWWRTDQKLETDKDTGYSFPHINVWIKLDDKPKKNIHLIAA